MMERITRELCVCVPEISRQVCMEEGRCGEGTVDGDCHGEGGMTCIRSISDLR